MSGSNVPSIGNLVAAPAIRPFNTSSTPNVRHAGDSGNTAPRRRLTFSDRSNSDSSQTSKHQGERKTYYTNSSATTGGTNRRPSTQGASSTSGKFNGKRPMSVAEFRTRPNSRASKSAQSGTDNIAIDHISLYLHSKQPIGRDIASIRQKTEDLPSLSTTYLDLSTIKTIQDGISAIEHRLRVVRKKISRDQAICPEVNRQVVDFFVNHPNAYWYQPDDYPSIELKDLEANLTNLLRLEGRLLEYKKDFHNRKEEKKQTLLDFSEITNNVVELVEGKNFHDAENTCDEWQEFLDSLPESPDLDAPLETTNDLLPYSTSLSPEKGGETQSEKASSAESIFDEPPPASYWSLRQSTAEQLDTLAIYVQSQRRRLEFLTKEKKLAQTVKDEPPIKSVVALVAAAKKACEYLNTAKAARPTEAGNQVNALIEKERESWRKIEIKRTNWLSRIVDLHAAAYIDSLEHALQSDFEACRFKKLISRGSRIIAALNEREHKPDNAKDMEKLINGYLMKTPRETTSIKIFDDFMASTQGSSGVLNPEILEKAIEFKEIAELLVKDPNAAEKARLESHIEYLSNLIDTEFIRNVSHFMEVTRKLPRDVDPSVVKVAIRLKGIAVGHMMGPQAKAKELVEKTKISLYLKYLDSLIDSANALSSLDSITSSASSHQQ